MTKFHRTSEWLRLAKEMRKVFERQVSAGEAVCIDCGNPIVPGQTWEVGHRLAYATHPHLGLERFNLGPTHRACNRSKGATLGNGLKAKRRSRRKGFISW